MNNLDILLIGETKIDSFFPRAHFFIEGCNDPLCSDVSGRSGGLLVFTKSHPPATKAIDKTKHSSEYSNYNN